MNEWDDVFRSLADDPAEYEREAGTVLFVRRGDDVALSLVEVPAAGLSVKRQDGEIVPVGTYIQRDLLNLPTLARQIVKTIDKMSADRPVPFIEGPATFVGREGETQWSKASVDFGNYLQETEPGATRLVQLMAPAGRGKTMLLENVAKRFALGYQPDPHPSPLLLKVDLLGRYVGTIDDAIAGSLLNEYYAPGLSHKDVALCIRKKWIILALDGFDELVARVGSRDAFIRITELIDQLERQGTIVLSARESFFDLYQVAAAIKSYLQPRQGSYVTSVIGLDRWTVSQGIEVLSRLGSGQPSEDFDELANTFENDQELIYHPFFLTRVAELWMRGERFVDAGGKQSTLARIKYVIDKLVDREAQEKWVDRDGNPFIPGVAHQQMLAGIAEEMWRSGAFSLDPEELKIAAQIGVGHLEIAADRMDAALERLPTHAAVVSRGRKGVSFLHDRFLHYFLAHRLMQLLRDEDSESILRIVGARELPPELSEWVSWLWKSRGLNESIAVKSLHDVAAVADQGGRINVSDLCVRLADGAEQSLTFLSLVFVGDAFQRGRFSDIAFENCNFWHSDLRGSTFKGCRFQHCEFGAVIIDGATQFQNCLITDATVSSLEVEGESYFDPEEIEEMLKSKGLVFPSPAQSRISKTTLPDKEYIAAIERLVKASSRTTDVAIEEMEEVVPKKAWKHLLRSAREHSILKEVVRSTSGPHKNFVRIAVDRDKLLEGIKGRTGDPNIDGFWASLR